MVGTSDRATFELLDFLFSSLFPTMGLVIVTRSPSFR